jgi:hypothetical protein
MRHVHGHEYAVPIHFRGLREFEWAGYHVKISVPFRDHLSTFDVQAGCHDSEAVKGDPREMIGMPEFGARLAKLLDWRTRAKHYH